MHIEGFLRHIPLRVNVLVVGAAGGNMVVQLNPTDFHDPMSIIGIKTSSFGVHHDFTHRFAP